ncbi:MAG: hypothetical protein Q8P48_07260 [Deltaproteobacteria bacterium]|nr:hypothetical protein [Deltaproteobacteria bacterium]
MSLSYRAYAKRRGVSPEAVSKAVKTGRITAGPDGKIDPERADREWKENTDQSKPLNSVSGTPRHRKPPDSPKIPGGDIEAASGGLPGGIPPYVQSRAIREAYEARIKKLDYEVKKGKLINADEVRVAAFNVARVTRDKLMNIPERLAPLLVGVGDIHEAHKLLGSEIRLICEELANDARKSG